MTETKPQQWPALSIKQPWAELIFGGAKDVEVRKWTTGYRGPLWIHTGKKVDDHAMRRFDVESPYTGGIIGSVVLWGVRPFSSEGWDAWRERHRNAGPFREDLGKYGWILKDPRRLDSPIPVRGALGLFVPPDGTFRDVELARHLRGDLDFELR